VWAILGGALWGGGEYSDSGLRSAMSVWQCVSNVEHHALLEFSGVECSFVSAGRKCDDSAGCVDLSHRDCCGNAGALALCMAEVRTASCSRRDSAEQVRV